MRNVPLYNAAQEGLYGASNYDRCECFLHYVWAPNLGLTNFVKLTSNAFALSCMILIIVVILIILLYCYYCTYCVIVAVIVLIADFMLLIDIIAIIVLIAFC
jgi:hypothetical protein